MRATFCRKNSRSGCLAKPASWPPRFSRISMTFSAWACSRRRKNSSALFPANPIVQRRISIKSEVLDGFRRCTESKFFRLEAERILDGRVALRDKQGAAVESREFMQFEKAVFGFALRFQFPSTANMHGRNSPIE